MGWIQWLLHFGLVLLPGVLIFICWKWAAGLKPGGLHNARLALLFSSITAISASWLLLCALELPLPFYIARFGQPFVDSFWRHSFPIGLALAVIALPLALFGQGRARTLSILIALFLGSWWYFLGLLG